MLAGHDSCYCRWTAGKGARGLYCEDPGSRES